MQPTTIPAMASDAVATQACCVCGSPMEYNPTNMCLACVQNEVSIVDTIQTENSLTWCKFCDRYLVPPTVWLTAELESKELMGICLKRIRGLHQRKGLRLIDAQFLWTEPHSRRIKVKLTIESELFAGAIATQQTVVTFIINQMVCTTCNANMVTEGGAWNAVVQLRQRATHRRTFLWLEQVLLRARIHQDACRISVAPDGLDFYFATRQGALKLVGFLQSVVTAKLTEAEQLLSHDTKSNTANFHYTYMLDLPRICKDDLVVLPPKIASQLGGIGPLVLVKKVAACISFIDPQTGIVKDLPGLQYWKAPFGPVAQATKKTLTRFVVLDVLEEKDYTFGRESTRGITATGSVAGRSRSGSRVAPTVQSFITAGTSRRITGRRAPVTQSEATARRGVGAELLLSREDEVSVEKAIIVRSHIAPRHQRGVEEAFDAENGERTRKGLPLDAGSQVVGYDLRTLQLATVDESWIPTDLPDVVLVHRFYPKQASRRGRRVWAIRRLGFDGRLEDAEDLEQFLDDIERDPTLRADMDLYHVPQAADGAPDPLLVAAATAAGAKDSSEGAPAASGGSAGVFGKTLSKKQKRLLSRQATEAGLEGGGVLAAGAAARAAGLYDDGHETEDSCDDTPYIDPVDLLDPCVAPSPPAGGEGGKRTRRDKAADDELLAVMEPQPQDDDDDDDEDDLATAPAPRAAPSGKSRRPIRPGRR